MRISVLRNGAALITLAFVLSIACGSAQQSPGPAGKAEARPPEASPSDIDGPTMFATSCGFCHQDGGRAEGKGPKLAGSKRSDEFIIERIKKGKVGAMPAFGGAFSEGQIIAILAYIRTLEDNGN
jgi:mono/diheme cytochrome c family protein